MTEKPEPTNERLARYSNPPLADQVFLVALDDMLPGSERDEWNPLVLPCPLRVVWAINATLGTVNNGNLHYFFENDWPQKPPYSVFSEAFRAIGATETAACLEDAISAFGFDNPHLDVDARRDVLYPDEGKDGHAADVIWALGNRIIDLERDVMVLAMAFIMRHIDHFPKAAAFLKAKETDNA